MSLRFHTGLRQERCFHEHHHRNPRRQLVPLGGAFGCRAGDFRRRGWLHALGVPLTVVGPLLCIGLIASEYLALEPYFETYRGLQTASWVSTAITACAVSLGVYAGLAHQGSEQASVVLHSVWNLSDCWRE